MLSMLSFIIAPGLLVTLVAMGSIFPVFCAQPIPLIFVPQCQGRFAWKRSDQTVPFFWGQWCQKELHFSSGKMGDEHHELLHKALKLAGKPGSFLSKGSRWKQTIWHRSSTIKQCQEHGKNLKIPEVPDSKFKSMIASLHVGYSFGDHSFSRSLNFWYIVLSHRLSNICRS